MFLANLAYGVTTTRDPQTATTDVLTYADRVTAGMTLGPRIYSTGPGVFSGEGIRSQEHASDVLKRYSEYYRTQTIKMYMAGNRQQRQWIITAAREQELMPTTEGGLDVAGNLVKAREVTMALVGSGIPVSMFIDPEPSQLEASAEVGAPWVELHTGSFAQAWFDEEARAREMKALRSCMKLGVELGLRVNAGHGINYQNVVEARTLDQVHEFNIGHSIVARAVLVGLERAVREMKSLVQ